MLTILSVDKNGTTGTFILSWRGHKRIDRSTLQKSKSEDIIMTHSHGPSNSSSRHSHHGLEISSGLFVGVWRQPQGVSQGITGQWMVMNGKDILFRMDEIQSEWADTQNIPRAKNLNPVKLNFTAWTLLLTMRAIPFLLRDSCPQ